MEMNGQIHELADFTLGGTNDNIHSWESYFSLRVGVNVIVKGYLSALTVNGSPDLQNVASYSTDSGKLAVRSK
jgi:hypothetical protein